jgi:hypothetical protein
MLLHVWLSCGENSVQASTMACQFPSAKFLSIYIPVYTLILVIKQCCQKYQYWEPILESLVEPPKGPLSTCNTFPIPFKFKSNSSLKSDNLLHMLLHGQQLSDCNSKTWESLSPAADSTFFIKTPNLNTHQIHQHTLPTKRGFSKDECTIT